MSLGTYIYDKQKTTLQLTAADIQNRLAKLYANDCLPESSQTMHAPPVCPERSQCQSDYQRSKTDHDRQTMKPENEVASGLRGMVMKVRCVFRKVQNVPALNVSTLLAACLPTWLSIRILKAAN